MLSQQIQDANVKLRISKEEPQEVSGFPNFIPLNTPCGAKILNRMDAGGDFDPSGHSAMPINIYCQTLERGGRATS